MKIRKQFADLATYSPKDKTAISVRDGVLEYLGAEIGLEPHDKVFTVYRSPATIANVHPKMIGIPLTDEHVPLDEPAPKTGSYVKSARMVDVVDESTDTKIAIENKLALSDDAVALLDQKRQLSLGYYADLIPHDRYDFEQVNIVPHHLAAVSAGRCGPLCSFIDRKPSPEKAMTGKIHKLFLDENGGVNLEQVVEMATALPEAIRKVPVERLKDIVPALQEMLSYAQETGVVETAEETVEETESMDESMPEEEKPKFSDKDFADAVAKHVEREMKRYSEVVDKARNFLDDSYNFVGKTANQIMRDALATQTTEKFADSELPVAFKLLRKTSDYKNFGAADTQTSLEAKIKSHLEGK